MSSKTARSENIEGPHGDYRHSYLAMVCLNQVFTCQLGNGVAPAGLGGWSDRRWGIFMNAEGVDSENLAGRKINEPLQAGTFFQGFQNLQCSHDIGLQRLSRVC